MCTCLPAATEWGMEGGPKKLLWAEAVGPANMAATEPEACAADGALSYHARGPGLVLGHHCLQLRLRRRYLSIAASSVLSFMALSLAALSRVERLSPEGIIIRHTHKGDQPTQHCRVIVYGMTRHQSWPPISSAFRDSLSNGQRCSHRTVCRFFSTSLTRLARARLAPARNTHTHTHRLCLPQPGTTANTPYNNIHEVSELRKGDVGGQSSTWERGQNSNVGVKEDTATHTQPTAECFA